MLLSPSDVLGSTVPTLGALIGGRVLEVRRERIVLADALGAVSIVLRGADGHAGTGPSPSAGAVEGGATLVPGDLVLVRVTHTEPITACVVEHHGARLPLGSGEFARLSFYGGGARLRSRARALKTIRAYFEAGGFVEVDTPIRVPSPGLDLHVEAVPAEGGWLVTSPEYHMKRLLVGGLPRIFQLVHCTRADEQGSLHEPEFMMLEWYRAFVDQEAVIADTEQIVSQTVAELRDGAEHVILRDGRRIDVRPPYPRVTVREAFRQYASVPDAAALAASDPDEYFRRLVDEVEPALARADRPIFLCEYPASEASLARRSPSDPAVAERFELYVGGVELCNGFSELTDPIEQRTRLERDQEQRRVLGKTVYPVDEKFLLALEEGMPPAAGNALGVDRLILLATGAARLADVLAFGDAQR